MISYAAWNCCWDRRRVATQIPRQRTLNFFSVRSSLYATTSVWRRPVPLQYWTNPSGRKSHGTDMFSFFQKYQTKQSSQQQRFRRKSEDAPHYPVNSAVYLITVSSMSHIKSRSHRLFGTLVGVMDNTRPRIYSYKPFGVSLNNTSSFLM